MGTELENFKSIKQIKDLELPLPTGGWNGIVFQRVNNPILPTPAVLFLFLN
jgi:hypothetical protein